MSDRTLKALVGALVVAVAAWLVTNLLSGGGGAIGASGAVVEVFDGVTPESVESIRLAGASGQVALSRVESGWSADGFDADSATVQRFLSSLATVEVGDLVATNPANHERMGVSADSAITLEMDAAGRSRSVLVGKQGPRFETAYVRVPEEDEVYLLEGDLRVHVRRPLDDWRDKNVVRVDTSLVARIEVERNGEAYTVVRGSEAEQGRVRNILAELRAVLAAGFLTEGDSLYALPQGASNIAYSGDGSVLAEVTLGAGDGERWARTPGDSVVYRISSFRAGRLVPTLDEVRPEG
jgi:hypothetical protein